MRPIGWSYWRSACRRSPALLDFRAEVEPDGNGWRIDLLAIGQVEGDGMAVEVGLRVDLGGEAAARAARS